jgi:hypothetical protein
LDVVLARPVDVDQVVDGHGVAFAHYAAGSDGGRQEVGGPGAVGFQDDLFRCRLWVGCQTKLATFVCVMRFVREVVHTLVSE